MSDPTDDELQAAIKKNIDKLHRWSFGLKGEFGRDEARELCDQVTDWFTDFNSGRLAGRASVTQPSREAIAKAIHSVHEYQGISPSGHTIYAADPWKAADAILALLGVVPSTGNKETP